ncbi:G2/M phase-specific E3 ubiquitin-protein ligase-like [Onychostoma macrolepis]|uniref:G2/M phase-specific E3 ubiquitin-protein ligase-like n=1 Tax=Onychostoma macrolepis TaxID=369639 RepID=UPI002729D9D1|nr:G2/M phase-specific E3 ubiquitin-protein ligase-like [Onychostoma macrolepis]XP_058629917.1 G2/M phase-specific E3 ubiquitin-protein ligase-like [Onychostoma macrolepis]XP_058629918.1 G2/M phase-specific E3 ubiquitin-protein ligase-like [Onychostoma macrolepis]XP_058629919.1 G2/M phase-specific E3 ubiquitin-protein ligase-like [Onychostoma macrolepis]
MLLQAGLGRRTVNVPEDACHNEITHILSETYPKMSELEGAWMLHKAMGGSGQRKLNLLTPEEEGYTGASLVKSWGGKGCLYIMPIQNTLDISPLPFTALEFQAMPKAQCVSCQEYVPLQLLGLHVNTCIQSKVKVETHCDDDIINLDDEVASGDVQPSHLESKVACPLCSQLFTKDDIYVHASVCGESNTNEGDADISEDTNEHFGSVSDILMSLEKKVDTSRSFNINVTREDLFQRGLKQWARQKQASPKNLLSVSFIGENGIDALRKEFLTGDGERGKNPKYSICDYQDNSFKTCGEIFATSLVQGGPAPNFLTRWCYHFLCHGEMDKDVGVLEVTDQDIKNLMTEVENAEGGERLIDLSDAIVACGYTGPINVDQKKAITDAIALHALVRLIPILNQLREGLRLYGLDEVLAQHTQMCQQLFVPGHLQEVNVDFLLLALSPDFSEEGSMRRQREMEGQSHVAAVHGTNGGGKRLSVRSFIQWVTGQAHVPLIESKREAFKITVNFDHDCDSRYGAHSLCYPIVNACAVAITFPTRHLATSQEFENNLTEAICGGYEFSGH